MLAGDHIYKMDYAAMLLDHVRLGAQGDGGLYSTPRAARHRAFGVMDIDERRKIRALVEKYTANPPAMPAAEFVAGLRRASTSSRRSTSTSCWKRTSTTRSPRHDFGMDVIPRIVGEGKAFAHPFNMSCVGAKEGQKPYWRDVGTLDSFWEANMDLASVVPELDIYDENWPIWTNQNMSPRPSSCRTKRPAPA